MHASGYSYLLRNSLDIGCSNLFFQTLPLDPSFSIASKLKIHVIWFHNHKLPNGEKLN